MRSQGYNEDGVVMSSFEVAHDPVDEFNDEPSMTRQEFADECDINILMAHYEKNAVLPPQNRREPQYFDASSVPDFRDALDIAREAEEAFMRVPAHVRKELDNDVYKFVEYCQDSKNDENLRKWGLLEPIKVEPGPVRVEVVNPLPPDDAGKT